MNPIGRFELQPKLQPWGLLTNLAPALDLSLQADGPDLFAALQQLRKTLEPLGW
jgi:hypothetical protein